MGGLLSPLVSRYNIISNKEAGYGRCDHMLIGLPNRSKHALIFEYKVATTSDELTAVAQAGLQQIIEKQYDLIVRIYGHIQKIVKIALAFCGKQAAWAYQVDEV